MKIFNFKDYKNKKKVNTKIIGEGEATGHFHRLQENDNIEVYKTPDDDCLLLRVLEKPATVTHEEHKPIEIMPNNYRVRTIKEKDHLKDVVRKVRD